MLAGAGFAWRWDQLPEDPFDVNRAEPRGVEAAGIDVVLVDDVDRAFLCRFLRGGSPCEVVGSVEAVRGGEVKVGGPDDVGVADVSVVLEGIYERKGPPALLDQDHVPQGAPVVQDGRVRLGPLGHVLQDLAPPVVLAHVVCRVGLPEAG